MSGWLIAGIVALCLTPLVLCGGGFYFLFNSAYGQAQQAARRSVSQNNLKEIGLAAHNFHSVYKAFPPKTDLGGSHNLARVMATGGADAPRMAWMTALLPFVDEAALWKQVDPQVPFDDPAAVGVYETRIDPFLSPAVKPPAGGLAPAHYAGNVRALGEPFGGRVRDYRDGLGSTIFAGEIDPVNGAPAAWGDPNNLRDPADGLNVAGGFGSLWENPGGGGGVHFVAADGSVHFVSADVDPATLRALATPDGGEAVGSF